MHGGDGLALLKEVKARYPHIPVPVMTCYWTRKLREEAMELGAFATIEKPFRFDVLKGIF